uniref:HDC06418 n=1 Tax=Drosophila melanogaster TaxID=7227 RepID=Q6IGF8_DROME|nr:TPA_inf: HDC06418 [Drosophila melanogaster]
MENGNQCQMQRECCSKAFTFTFTLTIAGFLFSLLAKCSMERKAKVAPFRGEKSQPNQMCRSGEKSRACQQREISASVGPGKKRSKFAFEYSSQDTGWGKNAGQLELLAGCSPVNRKNQGQRSDDRRQSPERRQAERQSFLQEPLDAELLGLIFISFGSEKAQRCPCRHISSAKSSTTWRVRRCHPVLSASFQQATRNTEKNVAILARPRK